MMRHQTCPAWLNDYCDLMGTFVEVNNWIQWAGMPPIIAAGLRSIGQIVSPDAFGQPPIEDFQHRRSEQLGICLYDDLDTTQNWLRTR